MPHAVVKMLKGRSEEQKAKVAKAVENAICNELSVNKRYVSVSVEDYTPEEWQKIFRQEVTDKPSTLFVKPGYDPEELL